ncbi:MAG: hypothetical protein AABY15_05315 [Nanoarchaeota archaeon]
METNVKKFLLDENFISKKKAELEGQVDSILAGKDEQLLDFFSNYTFWNGIFAGCVINLASRFHLGLEFGKYEVDSPQEDFFQTRGHRVAGLIFAAAEDEYADGNCQVENMRVEHKSIAWFMIRKMYEFHNVDVNSRRLQPWMDEIIARTKVGYGVQSSSEFLDLAKQLGFHVASEKLASYEFGILADKIKVKKPEFVKWLEEQELVKGINAFSWIEIHGPVEDIHANYALDAAQMLVDYIGTRDKVLQAEVIRSMVEGFHELSNIQGDFLERYAKLPQTV